MLAARTFSELEREAKMPLWLGGIDIDLVILIFEELRYMAVKQRNQKLAINADWLMKHTIFKKEYGDTTVPAFIVADYIKELMNGREYFNS